jgi:hypothetical protein
MQVINRNSTPIQIELTMKEIDLAIFCIQKFAAEVSELESNKDYRFGKHAYDVLRDTLVVMAGQKVMAECNKILLDD